MDKRPTRFAKWPEGRRPAREGLWRKPARCLRAGGERQLALRRYSRNAGRCVSIIGHRGGERHLVDYAAESLTLLTVIRAVPSLRRLLSIDFDFLFGKALWWMLGRVRATRASTGGRWAWIGTGDLHIRCRPSRLSSMVMAAIPSSMSIMATSVWFTPPARALAVG